jgi:hypothetical protein
LLFAPYGASVQERVKKNTSWRDFQSVFLVIRITKISVFSDIRFGIRFGIQ